MPDSAEGPSVGELSRQVSDVLRRFSEIGARLETQFIRGDMFELYKANVQLMIDNINQALGKQASAESLKAIEADLAKTASADSYKELKERIGELEDSNKWLIRLVIGAVIMALIAGVLTARVGGVLTK